MAFLNQPILWLLFAAAIPVIIHLLNRKRHRTVKWAAMSFILKATRESRGKKKLKHILILTARTLALAALVIAIAQPLISGFLGWGGSKPDTVVFILDRSLSMESETGSDAISKREQALAQVKQTLKQIGTPNLILLDSASGKIQQIQNPDTLTVISSTAATDTMADIPSLLDKAVNYIIANNTGKTEIWLASDLQDSNWKAISSQWNTIRSGIKNIKQHPKLRILALTAKARDNFSVSIKSVRRRDSALILDFIISNHGEDTNNETNIDTTIFLNGKQYKSEKYSIKGDSVALQETINLKNAPISGYGYISLPPDGNNRDNNIYFAYGEATPAHTLIVSDDPRALDCLERSSALPGFSSQSSEVVRPSQISNSLLHKASMLVWQAALPDKKKATIIKQFIESGGSAIFLPPTSESENSFLGIHWGAIQESPRGQYFIIKQWEQREGPQHNYSNGETVPLDTLRAIRRREIIGDITPLAEWDDNKPAMGRILLGKGSAYFITTLPDRRWSDLDTGTITVPIFQNMLTHGNKRFGSAFFSETGRHTPLAASADDMVSLIDNSKVNARYSIDPDDIHSHPLYLAGVKRIGEHIIATNRPHAEDDTNNLGDDELSEILKGTNFTIFENNGKNTTSSTNPIWQFFLIAALLFLIIEAILCLNKKPAAKKRNNPASEAK